jgi:hypothetical protein
VWLRRMAQTASLWPCLHPAAAAILGWNATARLRHRQIAPNAMRTTGAALRSLKNLSPHRNPVSRRK